MTLATLANGVKKPTKREAQGIVKDLEAAAGKGPFTLHIHPTDPAASALIEFESGAQAVIMPMRY